MSSALVQGRVDWCAIIERVRVGEGARAELAAALRPGLRLIIRGRAGSEGVIPTVLDQVTAGIRAGRVNTAEELARTARAALEAALGDPGAAHNAGVSDRETPSWSDAFSAREFDALRRFYLGSDSVERICKRLSMSRVEFDALRMRARARAARAACGEA